MWFSHVVGVLVWFKNGNEILFASFAANLYKQNGIG